LDANRQGRRGSKRCRPQRLLSSFAAGTTEPPPRVRTAPGNRQPPDGSSAG
jgi:hypothetical protein